MKRSFAGITTELRRLTVSSRELGSLGVLHGTIGRIKSFFGWTWREEVRDEERLARVRLDTAALTVRQLWPRELIKVGVTAVVALAMVGALTCIAPEPSEPAGPQPLALVAAPKPEPSLAEITPPPARVVAPKATKRAKPSPPRKVKRGKAGRR